MTEIEIASHHKEPDPVVPTLEEASPDSADEERSLDRTDADPVGLAAQSGSSPPKRGPEELSRPGTDGAESLSPPRAAHNYHINTVQQEDEDMMEYETGLLDDLEDEDEVISFAAPSSPVIAKPIVIAQGGADSPGSPDKTGAGRLRALSMNSHLTLNLTPQQIASPSSPSRDGSSSPTMGRFKVTTCQPDAAAAGAAARVGGPPALMEPPVPYEPEPPPALPQPKDERLMTPMERLQLYIDNPNMVSRNGVAVQYVNFIKDAEDPEAFVAASARLFDRLIQDKELSMRTAFLENLPLIVRSYKPSFKKLRMMAFLGESIRDENYNVRRLAQVAIGQLIDFAPELMTRETIAASVVPLLIQIFYAESTADLMIDALNLFCKLLDKVGPDPVRRLFLPEFNKLCSHDIAQIRQVCAQNLVFVVRYFAVTQEEEFHENDEFCRAVQERIIQLSQDFAWHVRETVASIFPQVIDICHKRWPTFTLRQLNPAYAALLSDQAKQVRRWATRGLGRVIATNAESSKTRLQLTNNGTVEFVPPTSYRYSDSELGDTDPNHPHYHHQHRNIMSPSSSEGGPLNRDQRTRLPARPAGGALSSPALSHSSDHPRRNYYNRLGIVTSLSHALNEADEDSGRKAEERPDFNSFRFWQNPIPEVAVTDSEGILVILPDAVKMDVDEETVKDVLNTSMEEEEVGATVESLEITGDASPAPATVTVLAVTEDMQTVVTSPVSLSQAADDAAELQEPPQAATDEEIRQDAQEILADIIAQEVPDDVTETSVPEILAPNSPPEVLPVKISPDSDDTRSVSSASSQEMNATFAVASAAQVPFSASYEIDPFIIEKHKRRDRAVMLQLKEAGEISGRLEDILPNVQFLREFLTLAKDSDRDTVTQVAVDFPAVALTVGRQFWPELQECHKILATNNIMQARELIAASLPRIAEIIGYYHTLVDLVPLVSEFLKDTDSVRLNMIENYSAFVMRMPPEIRPMHLLRLCEFFTPDEERNWRYRHACAEQIAHLALLFPPKLVVRNLMDGAWFFARDRTAEVRKNSTVALSSIFMRIEQQRDLASRKIFLQKLELFLRNDDFRSRQVFAQFCEDLLAKAALSFDAFSLYFGERFWPLFEHPVVAVRLAAARCLVYIPASGRKQTLFGKAVEKLQRDESRTIQEIHQLIVAAAVNTPSAAGN